MALDHLQALADYIKRENVSHISVLFFLNIKLRWIHKVVRVSGLRKHSLSSWFMLYACDTQTCTNMATQ